MALEAASFTNDLVSTNPVAGDNVSQGDDHIRLLKSVIKATFPNLSRAIYLEQAPVDLSSATTPDLSTPASDYINITGTTQIDGFATEPAGFMRLVRFAGVLTLNYNGTSFILLTGDDIVTAAGDHAIFVSLGSGNWRMVAYFRAAGTPLANIATAATESVAGIVEMATNAEIRAATTGNKAVMAEDLETAAALVQLTDAATIAVDWDTFISSYVDITASRAIGNPTNGQVGTTRTIMVRGNDGTQRTLTFGNQYKGDVPAITDITSSRWYLLSIFCFQPDHFVVSAKRAL